MIQKQCKLPGVALLALSNLDVEGHPLVEVRPTESCEEHGHWEMDPS
jgi:hypothetical protein